ncbi:MAG TPA: type II toxin-antitoxin system VapC family toxin [Pseudolabrys sp.]|nr:type II toxin-antitoxin system VapC family toxin [Pseudolabrys sp.]
MSAILVDSNVLLDVLTEDERWFAWSSGTLARAADSSRLFINPVVYAEISVRFSRIEELEAAIPQSMLARESIPYEAAFLAGKIFLTYRRAGGTRTAPLPDFFIGAHAAVTKARVLTRDPARFRSSFRP